jgi:hypothetical protein
VSISTYSRSAIEAIASRSSSADPTTFSGAPMISAYRRSWSTAAIRYVSSVISPTLCRSFSFRLAASLAIVVVLPTPVGPTSATTCGPPPFFGPLAIGPATGISFSTCSASLSRMYCGWP